MDREIADGNLQVASTEALIGPRPKLILDIGTNNGGHARQFHQLFPSAVIHCFEPEKRAIANFERMAKSLPPEEQARIHLHKHAIGSIDGTMTFYRSSGRPPGKRFEGRDKASWDVSGSILKPKNHLIQHPWCTFDDLESTQVHRLDTWAKMNGINEVDFIWADVQGAEGVMIDGGYDTISRTRYLYTEYSNGELYEGQPTLDEILSRLPMFKIETLYQGDVLLRNTSMQGALP